MRNPWGHGEWCLDWSDNPIDDDPDYQKLKLYQKDLDQVYEKKNKIANEAHQEEFEPYKKGDDGEFLMSLEDWSRIYNNLFTGLNL